MSEETETFTGTRAGEVGYLVIRNDHHNRIRRHCEDTGTDYLQLMGLYTYMSSKPAGWRFDAGRIAADIGRDRKSVLPLLRQLATLGYYRSIKQRDETGKVKQMSTFTSGGDWQRMSRQPGSEKRTPVTSENETFPQVAPESAYRHAGDRHAGDRHSGDRHAGERDDLVTTESNYRETYGSVRDVSHQRARARGAPHDTPVTDVLPTQRSTPEANAEGIAAVWAAWESAGGRRPPRREESA